MEGRGTGQWTKRSRKAICRLLLDPERGNLVHRHQRRARLLQGWASPVLMLEELMAAGFLSDPDLGTN